MNLTPGNMSGARGDPKITRQDTPLNSFSTLLQCLLENLGIKWTVTHGSIIVDSKDDNIS